LRSGGPAMPRRRSSRWRSSPESCARRARSGSMRLVVKT
jgi:hypothetical protein